MYSYKHDNFQKYSLSPLQEENHDTILGADMSDNNQHISGMCTCHGCLIRVDQTPILADISHITETKRLMSAL